MNAKIQGEPVNANVKIQVGGKDGQTPHIGEDGNWYIGENNTGMPSRGEKGNPGYSPEINVTDVPEGHAISIKDADGITHVVNVKDGLDGKDGKNATIEHRWDGSKLFITSSSGTSYADLQGPKGDKGDPGTSKPWLIGSTDEITPNDVMTALASERNVLLTHSTEESGRIAFSYFMASADGDFIVTSCPVVLGDEVAVFQLTGIISDNAWSFTISPMSGFGGLDKVDQVAMDVDKRKADVSDLEEDVVNLTEEIAFKPEVYGLPMLYLTGDISGMSKENAVILNYSYGERNGTCEVKWQGSSSLQWPKKNYTIKFDNAFEAFAGWGSQKKYCFKANFIDHSHARNIGSCKLWGQMVKTRSMPTTCIPHTTNGWVYKEYYTYEDGAYNAPYSVAVSGKGRYCINGFSVPAGVYNVETDVFMPSGGSGKNAMATLYTENANGAYALTEVPVTDTWTHVVMSGIDASSFSAPCCLSIQGRETENVKFRNIVLTNTVTSESIPVPSPAWQIKNLPNGGAIDGFPCIVMLNGEFHGLYTWNIPKDGWMLGTPKAIVSADMHCDATKFKALATMNGDFKLEYVEDENNVDWVLPSLNRAIQSVIDGHVDTVGQYIDLPSAIDYYIHTVDENAADGTSHNYLLVTYDGVKWYFTAYDRDTTYGAHWDGKEFYSPAFANVTFAGYAGDNTLMWLIYTYKKADLKVRAIELRDGIKSVANVATVFSNFTKDIPSRVFDEDVRKWPTIPSTSASNLAQIVSWYIIRRQIIDKEIDGWTV